MRGSQPWNTNRARILRANNTSAESKLWRALRNRHLAGHKFIRQAPIGPYYADFLCREASLIIEVDGATHGEPHERTHDAARAAYLEALGYRIYRATNDDIVHNLTGVLDGILHALEATKG